MICAFTGHRTLEENFDYNALKEEILKLISCGADTFYCGFAVGFDLTCAECVIELKNKFDLKLVACIPCANQQKYFSKENKLRYNRALKECDKKIVLASGYFNGCMQARDRFMADGADVILAYLKRSAGGTYYTVNYAKKKGKKIIFLN